MKGTACAGAFDDDYVPPAGRKRFEIMSPRPGEELKALILSHRPTATWSHYLDGKSYPCCRTSKCPWWKMGECNARWKAYLAGESLKSGKLVLIEVTHNAALSRAEFKDKTFILRGKVIGLYRKGAVKNSPVIISCIEEAPATIRSKPIREPFDVVAALLDIWGNPFQQFNGETGRVEENPPDGAFEPGIDGR